MQTGSFMGLVPAAVMTGWGWIAGAVALLVLGAGLVKRGRWPRRVGVRRGCRRCDYDLTGIASERCPECGSELAGRGVVVGERRRRAGVAGIGVVLVMAGLVGLGLTAREWAAGVDWYRYKPSRWVVGDLESSHRTVVERAWEELARRRAVGPLAEEVERRVAEVALAEQGKVKGATGPLLEPMVAYLSRRAAEGKLSDGQADRFFRQALQVAVEVRPVVVSGERARVVLRYVGNGVAGLGKGDEWWCHLDGGSVRVGEGRQDQHFANIADGLLQQSTWITSVPVRGEGTCSVEWVAPVKVYRGPVWKEKESRLYAEFDRVARAVTRIEERASAENPAFLVRPDLAGAIKSAIKVEARRREDAGTPSLRVGIDYPPANVAFEVSVRQGDRELALDEHFVACKRGESNSELLTWSGLESLNGGARVDVVLKASGPAARQTVDLFEIWDGTVVLKDVEIPAAKRGDNGK